MDNKIEKIVAPIVKMYSDLELQLLILIAEHFKLNEEFINSDYWRIKKLQELGVFNREAVEFIAKYNKKTPEMIYKALEELKIDTIDIESLKKAYDKGLIKNDPRRLAMNPKIKALQETMYNTLTGNLIAISAKVEQATRQAYLKVVDNAYLKVQSGMFSYQEAIGEAIADLGDKGIRTLTYLTPQDNGTFKTRTYDIAGTVKREVLNGVRTLNGNISLEMAKELDCEYLQISEHLECRPTHFDWQGTIIKAEDITKPLDAGYPGYGTIEGIYGINCRHYVDPYFGDPNENTKHYTKEECETAYKLKQKENYYERQKKAWKQKEEMFKAQGNEKHYNVARKKVTAYNKAIKTLKESIKLSQ